MHRKGLLQRNLWNYNQSFHISVRNAVAKWVILIVYDIPVANFIFTGIGLIEKRRAVTSLMTRYALRLD